MPSTPLYDRAGAAVGSVELGDELFAAPVNVALLHQVVTAQLAARRTGTHATLTRGGVRGGGKKPYRQKGTGRARSGMTSSPLWRGGGRIFPNRPDESFVQKLNRKMYRAGVASLLVQARRGVIGGGPEMPRLRAALPPNVELRGRLSTPEVREHMQRARAFLFAGIEDFGIVMAEAQACGAPLIAFGAGGATEIVRAENAPRPTGLLFAQQTPEAVLEAVRRFESDPARFEPDACRESARRFDRVRFRSRFEEIVRTRWEHFSAELATDSASR